MKNHEVRFKIERELSEKIKSLYESNPKFRALKFNSFKEWLFSFGINALQESILKGDSFELIVHKSLTK